jgi:hypothetical protein
MGDLRVRCGFVIIVFDAPMEGSMSDHVPGSGQEKNFWQISLIA